MTSLEFCHELEFTKINFIERKIKITHPKTILTGACKCGKSFLIFDYLSNFSSEDYVYIDLNDLRNKKSEIINDLEEYIFKNKIKVIVLENYEFDFKIPFCHSIIITTKNNKQLKGYKKLFVPPLDFEEYLLHDKKNQNITSSFNDFLKYGNLPFTLQINEFKVLNELQSLLKNISSDKTSSEVLKALFLNLDEKKSLNQLFQSLKKEIKISKDKFYLKCKEYEMEKIIYFLSKHNQEKAPKKIYCYNWAFLNSVSYKKKFKNELTNMIFMELIKKYEKIYYLDYIDFYIPTKNLVIVSIPFFNSQLMQNQLKKILKIIKDYKINQFHIITVSNSEHILLDKIEINILPFYEWALS